MKTALILVGVLCICAYAPTAIANSLRDNAVCVNVRTYTETFVPTCKGSEASIRWPNYEDATTFFNCNTGTPILNSCPNGQYFTYVQQQCTLCPSYIPPPDCANLRVESGSPICVPIESSGAPGGAPTPNTPSPGVPTLPTPFYPPGITTTTKAPVMTTTKAPITTTTKAPITTTTKAPITTTTTQKVPVTTTTTTKAPVTTTTAAAPAESTPNPFGPPVVSTNSPGVPMPPTPQPTPPNINESPPVAPSP